jgi:heat shock protein HslJ
VTFTRPALAVLLLTAGCGSGPPPAARVTLALPPLEGTAWRAEDIDGAAVGERAESTLAFDTQGKVAGRGACNRYFGTYEQAAETVTIRPAGLTRMACPPAIMDQEQKFLAALEAVKKGRREDGALLLMDGDGRVRVRLTAIPRRQAASH